MLSIVWSLLPDNDWWALPVFLCKLNPIKAHWGKDSWPFSFERLATFLPRADHVLVDLFSSVADGRWKGWGVYGWSPPTTLFLYLWSLQNVSFSRFLPSHTSRFHTRRVISTMLNTINSYLSLLSLILLGYTHCLTLLWSFPSLKNLQLVNILYPPKVFLS